jgi:hypothetical protein
VIAVIVVRVAKVVGAVSVLCRFGDSSVNRVLVASTVSVPVHHLDLWASPSVHMV